MNNNIISLLSSDEEENNLESHRPRNNTVKKVKTKPMKLTDKIPTPQKNAHLTNVRVPQNNNIKPNITVIHQLKQQPLIPQVLARDGQPLHSHKTRNLSSGITITPIETTNSHGNFNKSVLLAKPKPTMPPTTAKPILVTIPPTTAKPTMVTIPSTNKTTVPPVKAANVSRPAKRINPTKISNSVTNRTSSIEKSSDSDMMSRDSSVAANDEAVVPPLNQANGTNEKSKDNDEPPSKRPKTSNVGNVSNQKTPIHDDYKELMDACKAAEKSDEMNKVIAKLEKYYHRAHPDYIKSKSFHKLVKNVTTDIKAQPRLVYIKVTSLLEELRTRRSVDDMKAETAAAAATAATTATTAAPENPKEAEINEKRTKKIQKLSNALYKLQKQIRKYEEAEVDLDDDYNSNYLLTERYKKRAFEIYSKLCDLTGESRHAERIIKKPIKFDGTQYKEFNRKLQKFVNETKSFPDMFDVLRIIDHCNKEYKYRMSSDTRKTIAQDAFTKIGNLLQERRKRDLYEMVQYYTSNNRDPAREDPELKTKLDENHRHYSNRMNEVIDRFTNRQHPETDDEDGESTSRKRGKSTSSSTQINVEKNQPTTSAQTKSTVKTSEPPPQLQQPLLQMKMDADIEINDGDVEMILPDDGLQLFDEEDMREIEKELPTGLFPTIASVTSLHPSVDRFDFLPANPLEPSNIL